MSSRCTNTKLMTLLIGFVMLGNFRLVFVYNQVQLAIKQPIKLAPKLVHAIIQQKVFILTSAPKMVI
jgi:hypothetical protein